MKSNLFDSSILKNAEEAVEFITSVLESSTQYSIIAKDLDDTIVLWNEGARRLYGYEPQEVLGKAKFSILHAPEDIASGKVRELSEAALQDGKWTGNIKRRRKNGEEFIVNVVVTPRFDSSRKPVGFLLISRDISEDLRLTAQLESANRDLLDQIGQRQATENALLEAHKKLKARAEELEQNTSELKLLAEMGDLLHSCISLEEARQVTGRCLQKLFPGDAGIVYLNRAFGSVVEVFTAWNDGNLQSKPAFVPSECWALRRGRPHMIRDVNAETKCTHLSEPAEGGSICVPMTEQSQVLGLLHILWKGNAAQDSSFAEARERLAVAVADIMALALANVRLDESLKEQTIRDPLTKLYNRRYLEDGLTRELSRARRSGANVGVMMIDVDNFKQFNDSFGHPVGDELLRALGMFLKAHVRPEDIPARYGGEEFTLVLPGASREIIRERGEQVRQHFKNIRLKCDPGEIIIGRTSLSVGVAVFPEDGASVDAVLRAADEALYQAKTTGKDCVVAKIADNAKPIITERAN